MKRRLIAAAAATVAGLAIVAVGAMAPADAATWHKASHHNASHLVKDPMGNGKDTQWCKTSDTQWG